MSASPRESYSVTTLLDVAVGVFNERGYDGTSMGDLAAALGISKSSIYHHVAGKSALLELALDRALTALFAVLEEPASVRGPARQRLEHVLRRSVEVLDAELPFVTLLLRVRGNSEVELAALDRRREFDRRVAALVDEAVAEGALRRDLDPALVTKLVFGTVNSLVEWYRPDRGSSVDEVADTLVTLVLRGLERAPTDGPGRR
jgi:AcrR family transcriptional regulator